MPIGAVASVMEQNFFPGCRERGIKEKLDNVPLYKYCGYHIPADWIRCLARPQTYQWVSVRIMTALNIVIAGLPDRSAVRPCRCPCCSQVRSASLSVAFKGINFALITGSVLIAYPINVGTIPPRRCFRSCSLSHCLICPHLHQPLRGSSNGSGGTEASSHASLNLKLSSLLK